MTLRKAVQRDKQNILKIIGALHLEMPGFIWDDENFVDAQIKRGEYFVATDNRKIAGIISLRKKSDNKMYIETLAVNEDFRRQGVGTKLVEFAKEYTKQNEAESLRAYSFYQYEIGDFYQRLGFFSLPKPGVYNNHKFHRLEYSDRPIKYDKTNLFKLFSKPPVIAGLILALGAAAAFYIFLTGFPSLNLLSSEAVAFVNGERISKKSFEMRASQIFAPENSEVGTEEKMQVLDLMVNEALVRQDALQKGIEVERQEIDSQFSKIISQFPSEEEFKKSLENEGISLQEFQQEIGNQIILEKYVNALIAEKEIVATADEVNNFYEEMIAQEQENLPELSEVQEQIEQYIIGQKLQEELRTILAELRQRAEIKILI